MMVTKPTDTKKITNTPRAVVQQRAKTRSWRLQWPFLLQ